MATIWILQKPERITFPEGYERKSIETSEEFSGNNYTFIKSLNSIENLSVYLLGEYYEIRDSKQYPEEQDLEEKEFSYPSLFFYSIYIPLDEDVIYCVGNDIDAIKRVLSAHTNTQTFHVLPVNLDLVEQGFKNGLIGISGQKYTKEQGTIRSIDRKIDAVSFEPNETSFKSCDEVNKEYLEILMNFEGVNKRFNIYPDGKITARGRTDLGSNGFKMLRAVHNRIQSIIETMTTQE